MVNPFDHSFMQQHRATTQLALQTPIVNYRDGFGCVGPNGQHVDKDSFLKYNSLLTHHGSKTSLPQTNRQPLRRVPEKSLGPNCTLGHACLLLRPMRD